MHFGTIRPRKSDMQDTKMRKGLWVSQGGKGQRLLVLLHGLGANASVWNSMIPEIEKSWQGRWIAPDFRGHGRSPFVGPYGFGSHAADIANLITDESPDNVFVVGHSFGGVVGATLATGWFGPQVAKLFAFGVKLKWSAEEIAKSHELAGKPARIFPGRAEAIERYLKTAGLYGLVSPESDDAAVGVTEDSGGYQVRMDPRVFGAAGPSIPGIFSQVTTPFRLAAGAKDPMVTAEDMLQIDKAAKVFDGAGHNIHREQPEKLWQAISAELLA
jgi:pimeloyl-ACP methyl ester carboxylesterase